MKILHLDDEFVGQVSLRKSLERCALFEHLSYTPVRTATDFYAALEAHPNGYDCLLIDLHLGDGDNGITIMENVRQRGCQSIIIILSNTENPLHMTEAIRKGADDFLSKEDDLDALVRGIYRCTVRSAERAASVEKGDPATSSQNLMPGAGETLRNVALKLERAIARGVAPILVRGESGTGKELIAEMIARRMPDATPFVRVNCATIQGDTMESELFGHVKGSFTGASDNKAGLFSVADGGWIFLDEVARLSERSQASLLRVLESGEIRPLGSARTQKVSVKIVSATNEDLEELSHRGLFRRDLLERLRSYEIVLPPLRERSGREREEILETLLERLNREVETAVPFRLDAASRRMLLTAPFRQSNVRELWKVLLSAAVETEDGAITASRLPRHFLNEMMAAGSSTQDPELQTHRDEFEGTPRNSRDRDVLKPPALSQDEGTDGTLEKIALRTVSGLPSGSESLMKMALGTGYGKAELHFFAAVLECMSHEHPERLRSIRLLAQSLGLGRHVVTKKLGELVAQNLLPRSCRHLLNPDENLSR